MIYHSTTVPPRYCHTTARVPPLMVLPRYRHGIAPAKMPLPRYCHGTAMVLPPRHRPPDTATLQRYYHGTATVLSLVVLPRDSHGTEPMVLPRCRYQGTAKVLPPWYQPPILSILWYFQGLPLPWCCQGAATVPTFEGTEPYGAATVPNLTVLPRYRHGIATVSPQWYFQGTDLPGYCHGTATVSPWYRPNGTSKVPTFQGTATIPTLVVLLQGTAPMVLPRYSFQGTATVPLRYCRGLATVTSP